MRTQKQIHNEITACADLTLIQRIPAEQLEQLESTYAIMLEAIRDALAVRRRRDETKQRALITVVKNKQAYEAACVALVRERRKKGYSLTRLAKLNDLDQYTTREMLKHGRAIARSRKAAAKKAFLIEKSRAGVGVRPAARLAAVRFGNCSPSYAAKVIKEHKLKMMPELPLKIIQGIH